MSDMDIEPEKPEIKTIDFLGVWAVTCSGTGDIEAFLVDHTILDLSDRHMLGWDYVEDPRDVKNQAKWKPFTEARE